MKDGSTEEIKEEYDRTSIVLFERRFYTKWGLRTTRTSKMLDSVRVSVIPGNHFMKSSLVV